LTEGSILFLDTLYQSPQKIPKFFGNYSHSKRSVSLDPQSEHVSHAHQLRNILSQQHVLHCQITQEYLLDMKS
jgi:hypothetical protein